MPGVVYAGFSCLLSSSPKEGLERGPVILIGKTDPPDPSLKNRFKVLGITVVRKRSGNNTEKGLKGAVRALALGAFDGCRGQGRVHIRADLAVNRGV
jgi:hypothetical protein